MRTPTVCNEYLQSTLEYLSSKGISKQQLHAVMCHTPEEHLTDNGRFPLRLFEMLLDAGSQLLNDYYFGAHAGAHSSKQAWGMVNYLGMSAPSTREAVNAVVDFSRLLIDHGDVDFNPINDDLARLSWQLPPRQAPSRQVIEFFFTSWYRANKPL